MSGLTLNQEKILALTPKFTASLSIPCAFFIIIECINDHRRGRGSPIQRTLVGMSVIDIWSSHGWWLSSWAVPEGSWAFATGNVTSCDYQGFLLQLAIGAPLYNCSLAIYYLLTIKYNWSNRELEKIEWWVHLVILTWSIGTSIAGLFLKLFNHIGTVCWVIGSPASCDNSSYIPSDVPCERGNWAWIFGIATFYGPLWVCVLFVISALIAIYLHVQHTFSKLDNYAGEWSRREVAAENSTRSTPLTNSTMQLREMALSITQRVSSDESQQQQRSRKQKEQSKVATQAILYSASFFISWFPSTTWSIVSWWGLQFFWLDFLSAFCEPLQGFWNCLIFLRSRPHSIKRIRCILIGRDPSTIPDPTSTNGRSRFNSSRLQSNRLRNSTNTSNVPRETDTVEQSQGKDVLTENTQKTLVKDMDVTEQPADSKTVSARTEVSQITSQSYYGVISTYFDNGACESSGDANVDQSSFTDNIESSSSKNFTPNETSLPESNNE